MPHKPWRWIITFGLITMLGLIAGTMQTPTAENSGARINLEYTHDERGDRPTVAWHGDGMQNVLNHIGGLEGTGLSSNQGVNSATSANTWLKFGANMNDPDYQIRKYAEETGTPGEYDVHLDVRGNTREHTDIKPLDIVFVVDMSGSMEVMGTDASSTQLPHDTEYYTDQNGNKFYRDFSQEQMNNIADYKIYTYSYTETSWNGQIQNKRVSLFLDGSGRWYQENQGYLQEVRGLRRNAGHDYADANTKAQSVRAGIDAFLTQIENSGTDIRDNVNVGLVGFSSDGYTPNGTQVEMGLAANQHAAINDALDQTFVGGTFTQDGMRRGEAMLNSDNSNHRKIMIVLSDGVPTSSYHVTDTTDDSEMGTIGSSFSRQQEGSGNTAQFGVNNAATRTDPYRAGWETVDNSWIATLGEAKQIQDAGTDVHALGIELTSDQPAGMRAADVQAKFTLLASKGPDNERQFEMANNAAEIQDYLSKQADDIVNSLAFGTVAAGTITDPLGPQYTYVSSQPEVTTDGGAAIPRATMNGNQLSVSNIDLTADQTLHVTYKVQLNTDTADFVSGRWYQMNGATTFKPNTDEPPVDFGIPSGRGYGAQLTFKKLAQDAGFSDTGLDGAEFRVTDARGQATTLSDTTPRMRLRRGDYQVVETKAPTNYKLDGAPISFSYDGQSVQLNGRDVQQLPTSGTARDGIYAADQTADGDQLFSLVKTDEPVQLHYTLRLRKVDAKSGDRLKDAHFKLIGPDGRSYAASTTTDTDGVTFANLGTLAAGDYELRETTAPNGYTRLLGTVKFSIDELGRPQRNNKDTMAFQDGQHSTNANGLGYLSYDEFDLPYSDQVGVVLTDAQGSKQTMTITLANEAQPQLPDTVRLPKTGGNGMVPYLVLAAGLVILAISTMLMWKKGDAK